MSGFSKIIAQHSDETNVSIEVKPTSDRFYSEEQDVYIVPLSLAFCGIPNDLSESEDSAWQNGEYCAFPEVGKLFGYLILCQQMYMDGADPVDVCDSHSGDLEYVMSALMDEDAPMNEETGESALDVFYIDELEIKEPYQSQGLGTTILKQLPQIVLECLHIKPPILAYYPAATEKDWREETDREIGLRRVAMENVARHYGSAMGDSKPEPDDDSENTNVVALPAGYQFTDDELNMVMGRRHSGSEYPDKLKNHQLIEFYMSCGFEEVPGSRLLYKETWKS